MPNPRVNPKAKVPPWALALVAVGAGVAFYMYKKDKEAKELSAETSSEATAEAAPTELPYEPGYGSYGGGGFGSGANEQAAEFGELEKGQSEFEKEQSEFEKGFATSQSESDKAIGEEIAASNKSIGEILQSSIASLRATTVAEGSGGGAPAGAAPGGVTSAPVVVGQKPQPSSPAAPVSCTCGNGCPGHEDSSGRCTICMTKKPCAVSKANPKGKCCSW
jgi:hypothetical protein